MTGKIQIFLLLLFFASGLVQVSELSASQSEPQQAAKPPAQNSKSFEKPSFWGTRLINLPTDMTTEKGHILFRISHRYVPEVTSGYDFFYGLDGPANILIGLGYAVTDNLTLSVGRANYFKEIELGADWRFLEQNKSGLPFSAAVHLSGSLVTQSKRGVATFSSEHFKFNAQLSFSHQFNNRFSLLVVPAYSSNTNHWDASSKGTLAMGMGGRFMVLDDLSLVAEWIPVFSGYKNSFTGLGIGVEKKIGGHVFQIFILSSSGLTSDQFLPGGDLDLIKGGFHFGFNIFRTF